MPVSAFIADGVTRVSPDATLVEVADALANEEIGLVAIGDDDHLVGVVSERDLVGAIARRLALDSTPALDVASTKLVWCDAEASVAEVSIEMLENYVRHVLVEQDGQLIGVVSARDLLGVYAAAETYADED
jgi:signal-transduction protein with cAMP-binding, CBS, and nucleotidyltransferase domain